jgi:hypothetical protein
LQGKNAASLADFLFPLPLFSISLLFFRLLGDVPPSVRLENLLLASVAKALFAASASLCSPPRPPFRFPF